MRPGGVAPRGAAMAALAGPAGTPAGGTAVAHRCVPASSFSRRFASGDSEVRARVLYPRERTREREREREREGEGVGRGRGSSYEFVESAGMLAREF